MHGNGQDYLRREKSKLKVFLLRIYQKWMVTRKPAEQSSKNGIKKK